MKKKMDEWVKHSLEMYEEGEMSEDIPRQLWIEIGNQ